MVEKTIHKQECKNAWKDYEDVVDIRANCPDVIWDFGYIYLPKKPEKASSIENWGKKRDNRTFPYHSQEKVRKMEHLYLNAPESIEFKDFILEEERRREGGMFFYNGDKLEYITGDHYMYLQYWKIPVVKNGRPRMLSPDFRDMNRDYFYCVDKVARDEIILGLLFVAGRRSGKTAMSQAVGFFDTTAYPDSMMGIQSKVDGDAKIVFNKLVSSWKRLPVYLKPLDTEETDVKRVLDFSEPKRKGVSVKERVNRAYLNSSIFFTNSKEEALDGQGLTFYYADEVGKCKNVDPYERWSISSECLVSNGVKVGFSLNTTTVEDMEKYTSDKLLDWWNDSVVKKHKPNPGEDDYFYSSSTKTVRLFFPAFYGFSGMNYKKEPLSDKFGYTNIKLAKEHFDFEFSGLSGDALLSRRRKYPQNIDDCFAISDAKNMYPQDKILEQKIHNDQVDGMSIRRGNFYWVNGEKDGEVSFVDDLNGRFFIAWSPPHAYRSKKKFDHISGSWEPETDYCRTGCDPYSHAVTMGEGSKGAAVTGLISMPGIKMKKATVCYYLSRPDSPTAFCEDMLMSCIYFGSKMLSENNKDIVNEHFRTRGYSGYLMTNPIEKDAKRRAKGQHGINMTSDENREALMNHTMSHLVEYCGYSEIRGEYGFIPFNAILEDLRKFDSTNWTPYDLAVAFGLMILAMHQEKKPVVVKYEKSDWFPVYKDRHRAKNVLVR